MNYNTVQFSGYGGAQSRTTVDGRPEAPAPYASAGSCYVEFGGQQVGRIDVNFLSSPKPTGTFQAQSQVLVAEKVHFGSSRVKRWFGRAWSTKG